MIEIRDGFYALHTLHTTYAFRVMETGQLEHLYYGRKISLGDGSSLVEKHAFAPGNTIAYDQEHLNFTLEDMCLEVSGYGKGDIREPFVEVICDNGSSTTDFVFVDAAEKKGKAALATLPSTYDVSKEADNSWCICAIRMRAFFWNWSIAYFQRKMSSRVPPSSSINQISRYA